MARLTPTMAGALRQLDTGKRLLWRPPDVPGGKGTIRALTRRGLVEQHGQYIRITDAGRREVQR